ncbi:MAG: FtsX-like permease family protein, partial [Acidobacteriota bacterium]
MSWTRRCALGASRARIVQQLLTESVLLSACAAVAGLAIAQWTVRLATVTQPATLAAQAYTVLDWRVLGFTIALSLLTGLGFGLVPAFCLGRTELSTMGRTAQAHPRLRRLRTFLVVAQIAVSVVLFSGSLALGRAFKTLMDVDNGFAVDRIATLTVSLAGTP